MEIITKLPTYSDGEINRAFMREIKTGFKLERETEDAREAVVAKEAKENVGVKHAVLGRPVASFDARTFFRLIQKYGHEEVHSVEFLKDYQKRFPHLSPNAI